MWHTRKKSSTGSYHRLPIVVPALMLGLRPVAKTVMKGGLFLTGTVKQLATATSAGVERLGGRSPWAGTVDDGSSGGRGRGQAARGSGPARLYGY